MDDESQFILNAKNLAPPTFLHFFYNLRGLLHARLTHVIRPFYVSGHYFSRQAMFRSDQKLGAEGHDPYTRPVSFLMCSYFK